LEIGTSLRAGDRPAPNNGSTKFLFQKMNYSCPPRYPEPTCSARGACTGPAQCTCDPGWTGAGDYVYGSVNVGCALHVETIRVMYAIFLAVAIPGIPLSMLYIKYVRNAPAAYLGPCTLGYFISNVVLASLRVASPTSRTVGSDALTTVAFASSCLFNFLIDHVLLMLYVDSTTSKIFEYTDTNLSALAQSIRSYYIPRSVALTFFITTIPTLCILASESALTTEILTGVQWMLFVIQAIFIFVVLKVFMNAVLRACDDALRVIKADPRLVEMQPKVALTRARVDRSRKWFLYILTFDIIVCTIMSPWPSAQATLSYLIPYLWVLNSSAFYWAMFMASRKKQSTRLLNPAAASSSSPNPVLFGASSHLPGGTSNSSAPSLVVINNASPGTRMSTVVEEVVVV
jgi:hypothetical protein